MLHDDIERTGEKHASDRNINEMKMLEIVN
jgi:hypothetical protein